MTRPDLAAVRGRFPALSLNDEVLLDNAGGSQVPIDVADAMRRYMLETYVQLGAAYDRSRRSAAIVDRGHEIAKLIVGADGQGEVALGSSTSVMCELLAQAYGRSPHPDRDEIIVAEAGHESVMAPWRKLEANGYRVRTWPCDPETGESRVEDLRDMLTSRTRLVAMHHVSNLLGRVEPIAEAAAAAHEAGARIVVDGVAYAPHREMDVAAWDVDWYLFSFYKVYGPHMSALYGRHDAFAEIPSFYFHFIPKQNVPYAYELGGPNHEATASLLGLADYLAFLAGRAGETLDRDIVRAAFDHMAALEEPLQHRLVDWLAARDDVRVIGPPTAGPDRVPTVSFVHESKRPRDIAEAGNEQGLCFRWGHFYAYDLPPAIGLDRDEGVVRISLVHYNSPDEVERLIAFLDRELSS